MAELAMSKWRPSVAPYCLQTFQLQLCANVLWNLLFIPHPHQNFDLLSEKHMTIPTALLYMSQFHQHLNLGYINSTEYKESEPG
jgi:hypothetical protein